MLRRTARPAGVRSRSKTGEDCVGSAESLSELVILVRFEEEERDSVPPFNRDSIEVQRIYSPLSRSSSAADGNGTELELSSAEGRSDWSTGALGVS